MDERLYDEPSIKPMSIHAHGYVMVENSGVTISLFHFDGVGTLNDATILALEWALEKLSAKLLEAHEIRKDEKLFKLNPYESYPFEKDKPQ